MQKESVRTTVDIPAPLYRRLKAQAAEKGSSVRKLRLEGVRIVVGDTGQVRQKKTRFPLIVSKGPKVDISNDQIYEQIEFP